MPKRAWSAGKTTGRFDACGNSALMLYVLDYGTWKLLLFVFFPQIFRQIIDISVIVSIFKTFAISTYTNDPN